VDTGNLHLATLWETLAERSPARPALVHGPLESSFAVYEERAARLATALDAARIGPGAKVAILSHNRPEYLEGQFAAFKIGAVPVNVNFQYVEAELAALLADADAEALFFESCYAARVHAIRAQLPLLRLYVQIGGEAAGGVCSHEQLVAAAPPCARAPHSADDIYMLYTGGTTGRPKGVMYRHGDFVHGLMAEYENRGLPRPTTLAEWQANLDVIAARGDQPVMIVACPLMHATGMWIGVMVVHALGGTVVTLPTTSFDPDVVWRAVQERRATHVTIVGDSFAKPLLAALDAAVAAGRAYDLSSLRFIVSSGAMWSAEVKQALLARLDVSLVDVIGSSEGSLGRALASRGQPMVTGHFLPRSTTRVFAADDTPVTPGSGVAGRLAASVVVPLGYHKDREKSAATFRTIEGVRYAFTGDHATVEADGSISFLGRGNQCINTAGEKVYPEEVEEALKRHPGVYDCLVVGIPHPRLGECVAALVAFAPGRPADERALDAEVRRNLAPYKAPRLIVPVAAIQRLPNGKADYAWARRLALTRPVPP